MLVDPRRVKSPFVVRENNVEVDGSNVIVEVELSKRSSPANEPARPTFPILSKSTRGRLAAARLEKKSTVWTHLRRIMAERRVLAA